MKAYELPGKVTSEGKLEVAGTLLNCISCYSTGSYWLFGDRIAKSLSKSKSESTIHSG
jgi:hypothetical protein